MNMYVFVWWVGCSGVYELAGESVLSVGCWEDRESGW